MLVSTRSFPDDGELHVLDLRTGDLKFIGLGSHPEYVPSTGHLLYKTSETPFFGPLVVQFFDLDCLEFDGPAVTLRQEIRSNAYGFDRFGTWYESKSDFEAMDASMSTHMTETRALESESSSIGMSA